VPVEEPSTASKADMPGLTTSVDRVVSLGVLRCPNLPSSLQRLLLANRTSLSRGSSSCYVGEVVDLARRASETPQPLKKARVFLCCSSRHPRNLWAWFQCLLPECVRIGDIFPTCIAQLLFHPLPPRFWIGWVDRAKAEIVEEGNDAISSAGFAQRLT